MSWFHIAMVAAFILVAGVSRKSRHAWIWAVVLLADYLLCEAYLAIPKPTSIGVLWDGSVFVGPWAPQALFVAVVDILVCGAILVFAREAWERILFAVMMVALATDLVQATAALRGFPALLSSDSYGIILELVNYLALAVIGGRGLLEYKHDDGRYDRRKPSGAFNTFVFWISRLGMAIREALQAPWRPSDRWHR